MQRHENSVAPKDDAVKGIGAVLIAAVALAVAVWLVGYDVTRTGGRITRQGSGSIYNARLTNVRFEEHPAWATPAAVLIGVIGIGAAGLLIARR